MTYITANPHEGVHRAFFNLHPFANDEDYQKWCDESFSEREADPKALIANAAICHACVAKVGHALHRDELKLICFSAGYFEAQATERFG